MHELHTLKKHFLLTRNNCNSLLLTAFSQGTQEQ